MALPRNLAISDANVAYEIQVLHKPGAVTTVAALPANSFLTLHSTNPSSLTTGPDGDVTEETLQTFTYIQTQYDLDSNQKPKKIDFPTVQTKTVSSSSAISRVNSSFVHKENSNSKIETSSVFDQTLASKNKGGTGFNRRVTETFSFTPSETREEWESSNQVDAIANAVIMKSDIVSRAVSEVLHDESASKVIRSIKGGVLNTTTNNHELKLNKSRSIRKIRVSGDVGSKYKLIIQDSDNKFYSHTSSNFTSGRQEGDQTEFIIDDTKLYIHYIVFPQTTTNKSYRFWIEPGDSTVAASGVATSFESSVDQFQYSDSTLTVTVTESSGSDWSSISSNQTITNMVGDKNYLDNKFEFTFTATSSGKTGPVNVRNLGPQLEPSEAAINDGWQWSGEPKVYEYNYNGAGANVFTLTACLYISSYGKNDLTQTIDLDQFITLS